MSELPRLRSLVKHNVAAKHGSSKQLTSNELWLLELRIKSSRILASIPDALWDTYKSSDSIATERGKQEWISVCLYIQMHAEICMWDFA